MSHISFSSLQGRGVVRTYFIVDFGLSVLLAGWRAPTCKGPLTCQSKSPISHVECGHGPTGHVGYCAGHDPRQLGGGGGARVNPRVDRGWCNGGLEGLKMDRGGLGGL